LRTDREIERLGVYEQYGLKEAEIGVVGKVI